MINEIRTAFKDALDHIKWMDKQTRTAAKDKVRDGWILDRLCMVATGYHVCLRFCVCVRGQGGSIIGLQVIIQ